MPGRIVIFLLCLTSGFLSCSKKQIVSTEHVEPVIYPPPPAETRIQYLTSVSSSLDFTGGQSAFNHYVFGEREVLPIIKPYGIAVNGSMVYICDTGISGLEILDLKNNTFKYFIPKGKGQLQLPLNCDIDEEGLIYIADGGRKQVVVFDRQMNYVDAFSLENDAKPTDVECNGPDIWVSAIDAHSIYRFNKSDLSFQGAFPPENSPGLYQPANITCSDSSVYVSDIGDCKVKVYDTDFRLRRDFGSPGRGFGQFTRPKGLCVDRQGQVYVVDAAFENIQVFNPEGRLLMYFGGTYSGHGGMWLPADVEIDYENTRYFEKYVDDSFTLKYLIFVTNQYGPDKISVYGFVGT